MVVIQSFQLLHQQVVVEGEVEQVPLLIVLVKTADRVVEAEHQIFQLEMLVWAIPLLQFHLKVLQVLDKDLLETHY